MATDPVASSPNDDDVNALARLVAGSNRLLILTGAGVSTASGIPDYRDEAGEWKRSAPMQFGEFTGSDVARRRYWARSMIGWPRVREARPNAAHASLAVLEQHGHVHALVTQNVDGLHQRAGSQHVIDLHGRLDEVVCLNCGHVEPRQAYQNALLARNSAWADLDAVIAPDGDAYLDGVDFGAFDPAPCPVCGGVMKPRVVFYGESIPASVAEAARSAMEQADALLVVGSSLMVFSGYRFVRHMAQNERPVAVINRGVTRADDLIDLKINADVSATLDALVARMRA